MKAGGKIDREGIVKAKGEKETMESLQLSIIGALAALEKGRAVIECLVQRASRDAGGRRAGREELAGVHLNGHHLFRSQRLSRRFRCRRFRHYLAPFSWPSGLLPECS